MKSKLKSGASEVRSYTWSDWEDDEITGWWIAPPVENIWTALAGTHQNVASQLFLSWKSAGFLPLDYRHIQWTSLFLYE